MVSETALAAPTGIVNVIVRFREMPLFARNAVRLSSTERTTAIRSFDERFAAFDRDLARIDRERRGSGLANAAFEPARVTARYSRTFAGAAVSIPGDALDALARLDYVQSIHLDRPLQAFLDRSVPKIGAPQVWETYGTRGKGVVVAVIDTGIDYNHAALGGGFGPGHRVIGGWDIVNDDADPLDDAGHGTHVAGIIGGNGGGITGVAPEVSFLAYKVLNAAGTGNDSMILSGIERAADPNLDGNPADHADVANMSLGRPGSPDDPVTLAVETAIQAGVIFCIATGNAGAFQSISTPANAPSAISVGATTLDDEIASFSSKGPVDKTLAIKPEVVAPGVGIVSAKLGGGSVAFNGTSMATPHVAGVAALLRAIHPDWPAADIKAAIVGTAEPLDADVMAQGAGRVDAFRAAGADVIAAPAPISLGRDDVTLPQWSINKAFTLVNHGSSSRTLALNGPSPRAGITVTLTATSVTLAPGETREIGVTVAVDNTQVESPKEGSLAIAGTVTITGGAKPFHVPWAFIKAAIVTIEYDSDEPFVAFVSSTNSPAFGRIVADTYQRTGTTLVPAGEYDIKMIPFPFRESTDTARRLFVLERRAIDNAATISIRRDMAAHEIVFAAKDEQGRTLDDAGRNGTCIHHLVMVWPRTSALGMSSMPTYPSERFFMTPLSDRFTLLPFQRCLDFANNAAYSAQLEPIRGVNASITRTLEPTEWTRNPLRVAIPAGAQNPTVGLWAAWMWYGANWSFTDSNGAMRPAAAGVWNGTVFTTRSQHAAFAPVNFVQVDMEPPKDGPFAPIPRVNALRSLPIRREGDDTVNTMFLTPGPTTYLAAPGETLPFGEGLAHPDSAIWVEDGTLLTTTHFFGSLDEARDSESLGADLVLRDESGQVVQSAKIFIPPAEVPSGSYRFELTRPDAHVVAAFDTRRTDGAPPTFTALRLLDGNGRIASKLVSGEAASLLFASIDRVPIELGVKRGPVAAEKTRVLWKAHSAAQWNELPVTVVTQEIANGQEEVDALGHIPVGTVFRADLSSVTNAGASSIDLSLHVEDASGNSYEYTIEPAFAVHAERRRGVRH